MNIISIDNYRASQRIHPLSLLAQMSSRRANGCLRVSDGSTSWWIYLNNGDLVHASHSVAPFKRLERHLRQMNQDAPSLGSTVRGQVHQLFNTVPEQDIEWLNPPDYQAVRWLVDKGHLTVPQAATLLDAMAKEVFETFLQVREGVHELVECPEFMSSSLLCLLELRPLVEACQQQLRQGGNRQEATSYLSSREDNPLSSRPSNVTNQDNIQGVGSASSSTSNTNVDASLRVETVDQAASQLIENLSVESGAETPVERGEQLGLSGNSQSLPSNSSFRPSESSFQTPDQGQSNSLFPNLSKPESAKEDSSASQFGSPSTQLNFRRPTSSPLDRRDDAQTNTSTPSMSPRPSGGLRSSSSVNRPTNSSPTQSRNSKFLRDSSSSKISSSPSFYRDKDKTDATQRPSAKDSLRSSSGYSSPSGGASLGLSKPSGEKLYKVACIDDSPMILHMIEAFLEDKSFSVIKINDPVRALMELMRAKPDIILLDITMPNLDGYELCALLRSRPDFRNTPIIMVTGSKGLIDRAKARLVKASGYLTKPFNQTQLLKMIFKLLK